MNCFSCGTNGHFSQRFPSSRQQAGSRAPASASASNVRGSYAQKGTNMQLDSVEGELRGETKERSVEEYVFHERCHE